MRVSLALTFSGILANSFRMGTSNTRRRSRCCSMDGRMYLHGHAKGHGSHLEASPAGDPAHRVTPPTNSSARPSPAHRVTPLESRRPAQRHEAVLDDVSLCLSERAAAGQAVNGVKHGVHHDGTVLSTRKEWRTLGDEW